MEQKKDFEKAKRSNFDKIIREKFGDSIALLMTLPRVEQSDELAFDPRDNDEAEHMGWLDGDPVNINGTPVFENSLSDILINAEVLLPQGEKLQKTMVKRRHVNTVLPSQIDRD